MTVNLDTDVHQFTTAYAGAKGVSISAALNELVRLAEHTQSTHSVSGKLVKNEHGYFEIASTGDVLTPEMVKALSEDEFA